MTRRRTSEFRRRLSREWLFWLCAAIILLVIPGLLLAGRMTLLADQKREDVVRAEVFQSYEARQQIQEVLSLLQDAETGQRGYVLTGDPSFYTPSIRARDQLEDALDRLERLAGGEARQEARLQRLRTAIQDRAGPVMAAEAATARAAKANLFM
jgi:CHASE3 domain sensor protein